MNIKPKILIILLIHNFCIFSQDSKIKSLTIGDGLSQGAVSSILQDSRGFIWFGTKDGLDRFDGTEFKYYKNIYADSTSLIDNKLNSLIEDSFGRIWIATQSNGIECFDPETENFHHIGFKFSGESAAELTFPFLYKTKQGNIWISTFKTITKVIEHDTGDLSKLSFKSFVSGKNMPQIEPYTYPAVNQAGEVFIYAQNDKIQYLDRSKDVWKEFGLEKKLNSKDPSFLLNNLNRNDRTWVYQQGKLQAWSNSKVVEELNMHLTFDYNFYKHKNYLYEDETGNLWILFKGQLLKIRAEHLDQVNPKPEVIIDGSCENMYVDSYNHLWISTNGYGVRMLNLNQKQFEHWLPGISPMSIDEFGEDKYILNSFIAISDDGKVLPKKFDGRSVANQHCSFVLEDTHDYRNLHVNRHSNKIILSIPYLEEAIPFIDTKNNYWLLFENDKLGVLWESEDTLQYHNYNSVWKEITPSSVNTVFEDTKGTIYLSTNKGLVQISINANTKQLSFKKWTREESTNLSSNSILCAHDDPFQPKKYLWLGTKGGGLNKFEKKSGKCNSFTVDDGLPNNVVYGILPDDFGNLWLSTNYGLSQFNIKNQYFRNFTAKKDGLQNDEFNTSAFQELKDGRFAFGGVNGISVFHPKDFIPDSMFANVIFTGLKLNNKMVRYGDETKVLQKPIDFTKKIYLNHDQNFISISFASIGTKFLSNRNYYYKLNRVDEDWVFAGTKNEVSYPNLRPGTYSFLVTDIAQNGFRNPKPAKITFVIASPWWSTWLAYFIYAASFCFLIYNFIRIRLKRIKMQQELIFKEKQTKQLKTLDDLKSKFFSNITHEFRTPLTLLIEPARLLMKKQDEEVHEKSSIIFNNANRLLLLVNQLLDISKLEEKKMKINPFKGDVLIVIKEIFSYFKPLASKQGQDLTLVSNLSQLVVETDKHIIEKILYNLLSNAIKFTDKKGNIKLKVIEVDEKNWELIVEDDGIGISKDNLSKIFDRFYQSDDSYTREYEGSGIGLALVKEMIELIKGNIRVDSKIGKGTLVTARFPKSFENDMEFIHDSLHSNPNPLIKNVMQQYISKEESEELLIGQNDEHYGTILVVEDNFEMSKFTCKILKENGFRTLKATNGKQGLTMAHNHLPDLIIADIMMPNYNGIQLLKYIRNTLKSDVPVIMISALENDDLIHEAFKHGANDFIAKPFKPTELVIRIDRLETQRKRATA